MDSVRPADDSDGTDRVEYFRTTMRQLALRLSVPCGGTGTCPGLPVVDRTGIGGGWNFVLEKTCSGDVCSMDVSDLEKIGLKLEKVIAPVERLVVDRIDKTPTEN